MKPVLTAAFALIAAPSLADQTQTIDATVRAHILPRYEALTHATAQLHDTAQTDCAPTSAPLRAAYDTAFDAWIAVSHLRFGPSEADNRAFALAFWPDSRGSTPKALRRLLDTSDPIAQSAEGYSEVSIAARGFYALEYLLYDDQLSTFGDPAYHCTLIQTMTADIATSANAIAHDWASGFDQALLAPAQGGPFQTDQEVIQELFKALTFGLQFNSDHRLGRPLADQARPRPKRAETWRSGRSSRNISVALTTLNDLASHLGADHSALTARISDSLTRAQTALDQLGDPIFADISDPVAWYRLNDVRTYVDQAFTLAQDELGPKLGVVAGFNALDGD